MKKIGYRMNDFANAHFTAVKLNFVAMQHFLL